MRYFMTIMGILTTALFLLAILAGSAQPSEAVAHSGTQSPDATPLAYLALAGGTALLAGIVWLGTLRRVSHPNSN
jgi:hypothetical protein